MSVDYYKLGRKILIKVLDAIDYWCWNISGNTVYECYCAHYDLGLYDIACMFVGYSYGITEEDIKILEEMPDDIYEKLDNELNSRLESVIKKLEEQDGSE